MLLKQLYCFYLLSLAFISLVSGYSVYWNVPSQMCHKYGLNFSEVSSLGLVQNTGDMFQGDKLTILYDPGLFPAILDKKRNNGLPQEGNMTAHLLAFKADLEAAIPDKNFNGLGIIDFEHWRPSWDENWSSLDIYRSQSIKLERDRHPGWSDEAVKASAKRRFEKWAYIFMETTLYLAEKLRPLGKWGYYGFPYCFNYRPKNNRMQCMDNVMKNNERSKWMYETGTALYPSVYFPKKGLSDAKRAKFIQGRVQEADRIASKAKDELPIYPYATLKYIDTNTYISAADMKSNLEVPKRYGAEGVILWGSSKDTSSKKKCLQLLKFVENTIGTAMKGLKKQDTVEQDLEEHISVKKLVN